MSQESEGNNSDPVEDENLTPQVNSGNVDSIKSGLRKTKQK